VGTATALVRLASKLTLARVLGLSFQDIAVSESSQSL
jgi:hypothetical protein